MCGNIVHKESMFQTYMPKPGQPMKPHSVCGQCFVLVSILDSLRRIEHGGSGHLGIQKHIGAAGGRGTGVNTSDKAK